LLSDALIGTKEDMHRTALHQDDPLLNSSSIQAYIEL
jgi:hypothetical protein